VMLIVSTPPPSNFSSSVLPAEMWMTLDRCSNIHCRT
jgi:hypothetical protein